MGTVYAYLLGVQGTDAPDLEEFADLKRHTAIRVVIGMNKAKASHEHWMIR
jgi:hypothetical protein